LARREELALRDCWSLPGEDVATDVFVLTDRMEDCGDVLALPMPVTESSGPSSSPSGGSSMMIFLGLSSIGAMREDTMELRCEASPRLSLTTDERYDAANMVPVPEEEYEVRELLSGRGSFFQTNISMSA